MFASRLVCSSVVQEPGSNGSMKSRDPCNRRTDAVNIDLGHHRDLQHAAHFGMDEPSSSSANMQHN